MNLSNAELHKILEIVDCSLPQDVKARMFALGLATGQRLEIIRRGVGGDPIQIRIGATELMLRKNVAQYIEIREVTEES